MRRYLVVAHQTLGGSQLEAKIKECLAQGESQFHLVVPATRPADHLVWTEGEAHDVARAKLEEGLAWMRSLGADVTGQVGDQRPMLAIGDVLVAQEVDEIILSTFPAGVSRWLRQDLPARARREYGLPVTHVVGAPKHESHAARSA